MAKFVTFSETDTQIHPVDLYTHIQPQLATPQEHIYTSGPITSGGAARWREHQPDIQTAEIITANIQFIQILMQEVAKLPELENSTITVPHQLGQRTLPETGEGWREREYLGFWLMVIMRLAPQQAADLWRTIVKSNMFTHLNGYTAPRQKRIPEYRALEKLAVEFWKSLPDTSKPDQHQAMQGVVRLPDSQLSLGSTLEQRVSQQIGIPVHELAINPEHAQLKDHPLQKDRVFQTLTALQLLAPTLNSSMMAALHPLLQEIDYSK